MYQTRKFFNFLFQNLSDVRIFWKYILKCIRFMNFLNKVCPIFLNVKKFIYQGQFFKYIFLLPIFDITGWFLKRTASRSMRKVIVLKILKLTLIKREKNIQLFWNLAQSYSSTKTKYSEKMGQCRSTPFGTTLDKR